MLNRHKEFDTLEKLSKYVDKCKLIVTEREYDKVTLCNEITWEYKETVTVLF